MITCSADASNVGEPLSGTAPYARAWIVMEQPGPWGRDVLTDSHLDPALSAHLASAKAAGIGVLLARHPDRPERDQLPDRRVWLARVAVDDRLLVCGSVSTLDELRDWDLAGIAEGRMPDFGSVSVDPATFICTHSGRDRCCAVHGRQLINQLLADLSPDQRLTVWECSHVGGHRFAPVALTLPLGAVLGRLDLAGAQRLLSAKDAVPVEFLRGVSAMRPAEQAAAIAVLASVGSDRPGDLHAHEMHHSEHTRLVEVLHVDGRSWQVQVSEQPLPRPRLESCGKDVVDGTTWVAGPPRSIAVPS